MDLIRLTDAMQDCIKEIRDDANRLYNLAKKKADALAERDKQISIATITLKESGLAIGIIGAKAKGDCCDFTREAELHEACYQACRTRIEAQKAILNGLQSILRVQEEMAKRG